jgi:hypothetical protein
MSSNQGKKLVGFGLVMLVCIGIACKSKSSDGTVSGSTGSSYSSSTSQAVTITPGVNSPGTNVTSQGDNVTSQGSTVTSSTTAVVTPSN